MNKYVFVIYFFFSHKFEQKTKQFTHTHMTHNRRATSESWEFVCGAVPYLHMLLTDFQRLDKGVVEKLCQCLAWLVERFNNSPEKIEVNIDIW